jgi:UDP-hydrolysing UDP-N-acetyl-D-glucosamine 2-epimerase
MTEGQPLRVACITTSRADFGLYHPILTQLAASPKLAVGLIVSGMHLSPDFGMTVTEVRSSGFPVWAEAPCLQSGDEPYDVARACGRAVEAIGKALLETQPDLTLALGDRYEMIAAALAANIMNVPVAHIHGGEETTGAYDNAFRHAISKLSHLHFPATPLAARRLLQMGEPPDRVTCCGAPALDALRTMEFAGREELLQRTGLQDGPFLLVTYHPETLALEDVEVSFDNLWRALEASGLQFLITAANADTKGRKINDEIVRRSQGNARVAFVDSLGHRMYATAMRHAEVMIGNSSSGIIEAAHFNLPVVNIGDRQKGRERSINVIDCAPDFPSIEAALKKARSKEFRASLAGMKNVYGGGEAAACIRRVLEGIRSPRDLLKKPFHLIAPPC